MTLIKTHDLRLLSFIIFCFVFSNTWIIKPDQLIFDNLIFTEAMDALFWKVREELGYDDYEKQI